MMRWLSSRLTAAVGVAADQPNAEPDKNNDTTLLSSAVTQTGLASDSSGLSSTSLVPLSVTDRLESPSAPSRFNVDSGNDGGSKISEELTPLANCSLWKEPLPIEADSVKALLRLEGFHDEMSNLRQKYVEEQEIRVAVATWNLAGLSSAPMKASLDNWLGLNERAEKAHVYVCGFQEIVELNTSNVLGYFETDSNVSQWEALVEKHLNRKRLRKKPRVVSVASDMSGRSDEAESVRLQRELLNFLKQEKARESAGEGGRGGEGAEGEMEAISLGGEGKEGAEKGGRLDEGELSIDVSLSSDPVPASLAQMHGSENDKSESDNLDSVPLTPSYERPVVILPSSTLGLENRGAEERGTADVAGGGEREGGGGGEAEENKILGSVQEINLSNIPPLKIEGMSNPGSGGERGGERSGEGERDGRGKPFLRGGEREEEGEEEEEEEEEFEMEEEGYRFVRIASKQMVGTHVAVWVREDVRPHLHSVKTASVACGLMGFLGNKGCVSVSLSLFETSFCFLNVHLSAGQEKGDFQKRNFDFSEILRRTTFPRQKDLNNSEASAVLPETIMAHDRIFLLGDVNYRLDFPSDEEVRKLLAHRDWEAMLAQDELRRELALDSSPWYGWKEGPINFAPTYKYELNSSKYHGDQVEGERADKIRTPAWCDRILWCSPPSDESVLEFDDISPTGDPDSDGLEDEPSSILPIVQLFYKRSEIKLSDHRPVSSVFRVSVDQILVPNLQESIAFARDRVDKRMREKVPVCVLEPHQVEFGEVSYGILVRKTVELQNRGFVPAKFHVSTLHDSSEADPTSGNSTADSGRINLDPGSRTGIIPSPVLPSWVSVEPKEGIVDPGHILTLSLHAQFFVPASFFSRSQGGEREGVEEESEGKGGLHGVGSAMPNLEELVGRGGEISTILVVGIEGGGDLFLFCAAKYTASCWGLSLRRLVALGPSPISSLPPHVISRAGRVARDEEERGVVAIPKELDRMIAFLLSRASPSSSSSSSPSSLIHENIYSPRGGYRASAGNVWPPPANLDPLRTDSEGTPRHLIPSGNASMRQPRRITEDLYDSISPKFAPSHSFHQTGSVFGGSQPDLGSVFNLGLLQAAGGTDLRSSFSGVEEFDGLSSSARTPRASKQGAGGLRDVTRVALPVFSAPDNEGVAMIRRALDTGEDFPDISTPSLVASAMLSFLRALPEPIIGWEALTEIEKRDFPQIERASLGGWNATWAWGVLDQNLGPLQVALLDSLLHLIQVLLHQRVANKRATSDMATVFSMVLFPPLPFPSSQAEILANDNRLRRMKKFLRIIIEDRLKSSTPR